MKQLFGFNFETSRFVLNFVLAITKLWHNGTLTARGKQCVYAIGIRR